VWIHKGYLSQFLNKQHGQWPANLSWYFHYFRRIERNINKDKALTCKKKAKKHNAFQPAFQVPFPKSSSSFSCLVPKKWVWMFYSDIDTSHTQCLLLFLSCCRNWSWKSRDWRVIPVVMSSKILREWLVYR
jgi:hypothetical protein